MTAMRAGSSALVLALLAGLAAAGGAAWFLLLREEPPARNEDGDGPAVPPRPPSPSPAYTRPGLPPPREVPREGPWDPAEAFVVPEGGFQGEFVRLRPSLEEGKATGREFLDAWLAVRGLYVRWDGKDTRERFLKAEVVVPPDAYLVEGGPGSPLPTTVAVARESGFETRLTPPVLKVGPALPEPE
jgi:hypothetical protein